MISTGLDLASLRNSLSPNLHWIKMLVAVVLLAPRSKQIPRPSIPMVVISSRNPVQLLLMLPALMVISSHFPEEAEKVLENCLMRYPPLSAEMPVEELYSLNPMLLPVFLKCLSPMIQGSTPRRLLPE